MPKGLSFYGSKCTKDCSGHDAGYKWRKSHQSDTVKTRSPSFLSGTVIRDLHKTQGRNPIGTMARNIATGKFQKIIKRK